MDDVIELFEVIEVRKPSTPNNPNPVVEQQGALTGKEIMDIDIMFKNMPRWDNEEKKVFGLIIHTYDSLQSISFRGLISSLAGVRV